MNLLRIIGIGLCGVVFSGIIKQTRPELSLQIIIITSVIILFDVINSIAGVFEYIYEIADRFSIDNTYISIVIKIIGIAYIGQFACDICIDSGHKAIAGKIEIGIKVLILIYAIPVAEALLDTITGLVP